MTVKSDDLYTYHGFIVSLAAFSASIVWAAAIAADRSLCLNRCTLSHPRTKQAQ